jgi:hypothetical protein
MEIIERIRSLEKSIEGKTQRRGEIVAEARRSRLANKRKEANRHLDELTEVLDQTAGEEKQLRELEIQHGSQHIRNWRRLHR